MVVSTRFTQLHLSDWTDDSNTALKETYRLSFLGGSPPQITIKSVVAGSVIVATQLAFATFDDASFFLTTIATISFPVSFGAVEVSASKVVAVNINPIPVFNAAPGYLLPPAAGSFTTSTAFGYLANSPVTTSANLVSQIGNITGTLLYFGKRRVASTVTAFITTGPTAYLGGTVGVVAQALDGAFSPVIVPTFISFVIANANGDVVSGFCRTGVSGVGAGLDGICSITVSIPAVWFAMAATGLEVSVSLSDVFNFTPVSAGSVRMTPPTTVSLFDDVYLLPPSSPVQLGSSFLSTVGLQNVAGASISVRLSSSVGTPIVHVALDETVWFASVLYNSPNDVVVVASVVNASALAPTLLCTVRGVIVKRGSKAVGDVTVGVY